jgi:outer membrane lipoprotein-sorting protein
VSDRTLALAFVLLLAVAFLGGVCVGQRSERERAPADLSGYQQALDTLGIVPDVDAQ